MSKIVKWWKLISYIGVNKANRFANYKLIVLTNQISFVTFLLGIIVLISYGIDRLSLAIYIQSVSVVFYGLPLVFNYFQRFELAKVVLILSANISLFLTSSMLGYNSGEHYAYFALMVGPFLLFDKGEKGKMWFFSLLSGAFLIALHLTDFSLLLLPTLSEDIQKSIFLTSVGATIVIILAAINYFRRISDQHIDTIIQNTYEELKAIFDNSMDAIFILNPKTKIITECNDRSLEIFGFPHRKNFIGNNFFSLQKEFPDTSVMATIEQAIARDKRWTSDGKYQQYNGDEFWGNLALTYVELEDRNLLVARLTDITENKENAILLENLTQDLKKVQKIVKLGYWHLDVATNHVIHCSEEVRNQFLLDDTLEEITFDQFVTHVHKKDLSKIKKALSTLLSDKKTFELEFRVISQGDPTWIYTKSDLVVNEQGEVVKVICTSLDITERKKAEERLKASEKNYRKLASNIPDTDIFLFNKQLRIILAEGTIMQKHGLSSRFFEGKLVDEVLDEKFKDRIKPLYEAVIKGEKISTDIALKEEFLNMRGVPLRDANNVINGGLMVSQDITLRKRNEQELIKAKEEAERASMAKAQFLSTMSHELRTPLNAVIGISHYLLQEDLKPEQSENLHLLRFSAENLLALINDILDFSKIEAGKVELEKIEFSIAELLNSIIQTMKFRAEEKNLQLDLKVAEEIPDFVIGDPTKLSQIMNNLVGNAIKFTEKGSVGVKVTVQEKNDKSITLSFVVEDTGVGIPDKKLETIFEQFSQADSNTTRKFGGTGLGLTITKKLLELQNSKINVSSTLNQGSVFSFTLTYDIAQAPKKKYENTSMSKIQQEGFQGMKVLLVEDNPANVLIASKFMERWKLAHDHAENGEVAVKMAAAYAYNLILMDLQMPVMDGYQAAREIRKFDQTVPIIALTASAMLETKLKIRDVGMDEIITKPFNPAELYQKIVDWIRMENKIGSSNP